jgi:hypothetical protein
MLDYRYTVGTFRSHFSFVFLVRIQRPGLPDGIFFEPKISILEGSGMINFGICMLWSFWYILWAFACYVIILNISWSLLVYFPSCGKKKSGNPDTAFPLPTFFHQGINWAKRHFVRACYWAEENKSSHLRRLIVCLIQIKFQKIGLTGREAKLRFSSSGNPQTVWQDWTKFYSKNASQNSLNLNYSCQNVHEVLKRLYLDKTRI